MYGRDFTEMFVTLLILAALMGAAVTLVAIHAVPWLWSIVKPWLHTITG